jgi:hypothetical protein
MCTQRNGSRKKREAGVLECWSGGSGTDGEETLGLWKPGSAIGARFIPAWEKRASRASAQVNRFHLFIPPRTEWLEHMGAGDTKNDRHEQNQPQRHGGTEGQSRNQSI